MCGIAGIVSYNGQVSYPVLEKMTDIIAHRGPDGKGHWIDDTNSVGLGHRRLSIIDLSEGGSQPMHYADNRYSITFNGEIYNYLELKETLLAKGYSFKSTSDTEVLLALYDLHKEECLNYLDGMFAFAIWDAQGKTLFFARDRFGEKPFHYAYEPGKYFIFSSEMKSLWAYGIPRALNNQMLYRYLVYGELMNQEDLSETFYANISRLKAAHYGKLHLPTFKLELKQYWDINCKVADNQISEKEAESRFRDLFFTSVSRRLRADVPVGSSLSGGLDSSLIVSAIYQLRGSNGAGQHTFSARFPKSPKDEGKYMDKIIEHVKPTAHFVYPNHDGFLKQLEDVAYFQEEPFGTASISVQYDVMKLAKDNNITVLLDGQGADEILAGYHYYYPVYFRQLRREDKQAFETQLGRYYSLHADNTINHIVYNEKWTDRIRDWMPLPLLRLVRNKKQDLSHQRDSFIARDFESHYSGRESRLWENDKNLNHALYKSATGNDLQVLLRYADRNSMAHSREVRLPYLSHELVEFLFRLPARFKINDGWTKYLMRKSFQDILPKEITWRKDKIGYEPPQQVWMDNKDVKEQVYSFKEQMVKEHILEPSVLNREFNEHKTIFDDKNWKILMTGLLLKG